MLLLLLPLFPLSSCESDQPSVETVPAPALPALPPTPLFDPDSAYAFVQKQVSFGPRVPGTATHKACGDWMVARLTITVRP